MNLSKALLPSGFKLEFLGVGSCASPMDLKKVLQKDYTYIGNGDAKNLKQQVKKLVTFLVSKRTKIIFTYGDMVTMQSKSYLPEWVQVVFICSTPTNYAMRCAAYATERTSRIVAVNDYIKKELVSRFNLPEYKVQLIPSEVDLSLYPTLEEIEKRTVNHLLQLVFVGRIRDIDKGIDLLPKITLQLKRQNVKFKLTIIGNGPQKYWLKETFSKLGMKSEVVFINGKLPQELPKLIFGHDILLMPSRFEGCPRVLLEAMAAGVVPIVSRLSGVTDSIITHNKQGLLCPVNNIGAFVDSIYSLYKNPEYIKKMSRASRLRIEDRFSLRKIAKEYRSLLNSVIDEPPKLFPSLSTSQFKPDKYLYKMNRGWRSRVPKSFKKWLLGFRANLKQVITDNRERY
jgi:glycosyltransferase involved in cell wall biosynthesis